MIASLLVIALLVLIWARYRFARENRIAWAVLCLDYMLRTTEANPDRNDNETFETLSQVWPTFWIIAYFWVWDYTYFIVDQEGLGVVAGQLARQ